MKWTIFIKIASFLSVKNYCENALRLILMSAQVSKNAILNQNLQFFDQNWHFFFTNIDSFKTLKMMISIKMRIFLYKNRQFHCAIDNFHQNY